MMLTASQEAQGERLLSYVVASSDMRFIEINERVVYLSNDLHLGPVVQGKVPGCGPDCSANLSEMFLEYTMSCEDCRDQAATARNIDHFGELLAGKLIAKLDELLFETTDLERLAKVMDIVLNSMGVTFQKEPTFTHLHYDLAYCPIHQAAQTTGLNLWIAAAHSAFVTLCHGLLRELAPDYTLVQPALPRTEAPLEHILISAK